MLLISGVLTLDSDTREGGNATGEASVPSRRPATATSLGLKGLDSFTSDVAMGLLQWRLRRLRHAFEGIRLNPATYRIGYGFCRALPSQCLVEGRCCSLRVPRGSPTARFYTTEHQQLTVRGQGHGSLAHLKLPGTLCAQ